MVWSIDRIVYNKDAKGLFGVIDCGFPFTGCKDAKHEVPIGLLHLKGKKIRNFVFMHVKLHSSMHFRMPFALFGFYRATCRRRAGRG